jgi:hypothetical protein
LPRRRVWAAAYVALYLQGRTEREAVRAADEVTMKLAKLSDPQL